jgi:hypothetical protein
MNLIAVLDAAHMSPPDIVKLTCYVVGAQDVEVLYAARRAWLGAGAPAATLIVVQGLAAPELMVEIEAIASADDAPTPTRPAGEGRARSPQEGSDTGTRAVRDELVPAKRET